MDLLNNFKEKASEYSSKYSNKQKISLGIAALALVAITTSLIIYFTRPEYVTLYRDLDLKTASDVTRNLDDMRVPYRLNSDGSISVPAQHINRARLDLAAAGLPNATFDYNDLINRNTMFMNDDEKNQARNFALQNEIAKVIREIPGIDNAFVNLSIPRTQEFILQENRQESKASVFLSINENANINPESINGIAMLVANSVEGLRPENVTVHGPTGQVLNHEIGSDGLNFESSTNLELQDKVKRDIEQSLNNFLNPIYGYGNVSVMASVRLNFDTDVTQSRTFAPPIEGETEGLIRSLQESIESVENEQGAMGAPGVDANQGEDDVVNFATLDPNTMNSNYDKQERIINYELNEIVKNVERAKGQIEHLTVAVVLNQDTLEGGELSEEQRTEITSLITAATGLETRAVEIYAQSFNQDIRQALQSPEATGGVPMWGWIALGLIALIPILALGAFVFIKRRKEKQEKEKELLDIQSQQSKISDSEIDQIEFEIKESGHKKSIENLINTNPEIVTQLLKTWLDEE